MTRLPPIAPNEKSYNVNLLHQILGVLGFRVAKTEVSQQKAGESTLRQVRVIQTQLNVSVNDDTLERKKSVRNRFYKSAMRKNTCRAFPQGSTSQATWHGVLL